jgi:integrase
MAKKGISTRSEALEFDDFQRLIQALHADKEYRWEMFCLISCTLALRISDVLNLKWKDLLHKDHCTVTEIKTGKTRQIPLKQSNHTRITEIYALMGKPYEEEYVFINHKKGTVYTPQRVNQILKEYRIRYKLPIQNFSSHTFRKTFGRRVYNVRGKTHDSIVRINRAFQHKSIGTTLIYLGIYQDEVNEVYEQVAI